jgi:hypothetical protein
VVDVPSISTNSFSIFLRKLLILVVLLTTSIVTVRVWGTPNNPEPGQELPFDTPGTELLARHAALIKASSVVVMGSLTSSLFQAAAWGVPSILDRGGQKPESRAATPVLFEDADASGMIADGMAVTQTVEELIDTIRRYLDDPGWDADVWNTIAGKWDYQDSNYVANFMKLIE